MPVLYSVIAASAAFVCRSTALGIVVPLAVMAVGGLAGWFGDGVSAVADSADAGRRDPQPLRGGHWSRIHRDRRSNAVAPRLARHQHRGSSMAAPSARRLMSAPPRRQRRKPGDALTFTEAARREQITTLAIDLIAEHGYAGTSLAKIAEAAGLSNAAVLYHFGSKNAVLESAYAKVISDLAESVSTAMTGAPSARDSIDAYVRVAGGLHGEQPDVPATDGRSAHHRRPRPAGPTTRGRLEHAASMGATRGRDDPSSDGTATSAPSTPARTPSPSEAPSTECSPKPSPIPGTTSTAPSTISSTSSTAPPRSGRQVDRGPARATRRGPVAGSVNSAPLRPFGTVAGRLDG